MGRGGAASALQTAFVSTCRTARRAIEEGKDRERGRTALASSRSAIVAHRSVDRPPHAVPAARLALEEVVAVELEVLVLALGLARRRRRDPGPVALVPPARRRRPAARGAPTRPRRAAALLAVRSFLLLLDEPPAEPLPPRLLRLVGRLLAAPHLVLAVLLVPARQAPHDGARPPVAQQRHGVALVLGTVRRELRGGALPEGAAGGDGRVEVGRDDGRRRRGV